MDHNQAAPPQLHGSHGAAPPLQFGHRQELRAPRSSDLIPKLQLVMLQRKFQLCKTQQLPWFYNHLRSPMKHSLSAGTNARTEQQQQHSISLKKDLAAVFSTLAASVQRSGAATRGNRFASTLPPFPICHIPAQRGPSSQAAQNQTSSLRLRKPQRIHGRVTELSRKLGSTLGEQLTCHLPPHNFCNSVFHKCSNQEVNIVSGDQHYVLQNQQAYHSSSHFLKGNQKAAVTHGHKSQSRKK